MKSFSRITSYRKIDHDFFQRRKSSNSKITKLLQYLRHASNNLYWPSFRSLNFQIKFLKFLYDLFYS